MTKPLRRNKMNITVADRLRMKMYRMANSELNLQLKWIGQLIVKEGLAANPDELNKMIQNVRTVKEIMNTIQELL